MIENWSLVRNHSCISIFYEEKAGQTKRLTPTSKRTCSRRLPELRGAAQIR